MSDHHSLSAVYGMTRIILLMNYLIENKIYTLNDYYLDWFVVDAIFEIEIVIYFL